MEEESASSWIFSIELNMSVLKRITVKLTYQSVNKSHYQLIINLLSAHYQLIIKSLSAHYQLIISSLSTHYQITIPMKYSRDS